MGSSFSLIFVNKAGRGDTPEGGMAVLHQCLSWLLPKSLLGFRDHGGCAALLSLHCSPASCEFVRNEPHMTAGVHEDKQLLSSAGLDSGQRKGAHTDVVIS